MTLLNKERFIMEPVKRIGGIIPEGELTLITGLPGSGKTHTTIKFLNQHGITPIYFNLDYTSLDLSLKTDSFDDKYIKELIDGNIEDLNNHVIIIDTYIRLEECVGYTKNVLANKLFEITRKYKSAVIVLAHPENYASGDGVFKDNQLLARNCFEHIHFTSETKVSTKKGIATAQDVRYIHIKKGRNYDGDRIIFNWCRD